MAKVSLVTALSKMCRHGVLRDLRIVAYWRHLPAHCSSVPALFSNPHGASFSSSSNSCSNSVSNTLPLPPVPAKRPFERSKHGRRWQDPYHWMRVDQQEAVKHLRRENAYAESFMADTVPLQRTLLKEMAGRLRHQDVSSPPERIGSWLYYTQIPEGKEYPVYCRKKDVNSGKDTEEFSWRKLTASIMRWENDHEEVLMDQNLLVEQFGYAQLGTCRLSQDHDLMAFTLDTSGNEVFTLYIKDLRTNEILSKHTKDSVVSVEWAKDGRSLFYSVADNLLRPWRIFHRRLDCSDEDTLILEDRNASCFLDVSRTKDWSFITVNVNSKISSEVYLIDANDSAGGLQLVQERKNGIQYFVEHHEGFLYMLVNSDPNGNTNGATSGNYRLVRCSLEQLGPDNWQEVVGPDDEAFIEDMEIFERYLVLYLRRDGLPLVQVLDLPLATTSHSMRTLPLPQEICTVVPGANEDFRALVLRISVSSPNLPETVLEYDLASGRGTVLQQDKVANLSSYSPRRRGAAEDHRTPQYLASLFSNSQPGGNVHNEGREKPVDLSSHYVCQRHQVTSTDGSSVPLTVVHSRTLKRDGRNPALLIGYGAYGKPLEVEWCSERLSLLDRGWVVAFSHARGGGELGKAWHQSGQLLQKKHSFQDFIASARFLVKEMYADKCKLGAWGVSAGGLLVAGAINQHPGLFQAVVLQVPFLDISNTLWDKDLPLSVHEYDEWGDPDDPKAFANICSYSPYDNVQVGVPYPAVLVKAGYLDTRVGYWEAAKWVAKVRDAIKQVSSKVILLKTCMDSGHFGEGGRLGHLRDTAYDYAFLIKMLDS